MSKELELSKEWQEEAKKQTLESLPEFLDKLAKYPHDYGTICRAIAAAATAAAWAMDRSPNGGISGFQAGCVTWDFLQHWGNIKFPSRIVEFENMLYPQYWSKFITINKDTWAWIQAKAQENLDKKESYVNPEIIEHWQSIVDGKIPFGYSVVDD